MPDDLPLDVPIEATSYRVLARKYRPETFADLVGQEAMVRTLRNAFAAGRIAQAVAWQFGLAERPADWG